MANRKKVKSAPSESRRLVRFVYLSASDRSFVPAYSENLERGARYLQQWFAERLDGYTFLLNEPEVVEWYQLSWPADWYQSNPKSRSTTWYWESVLEEAFALTGADFDQEEYRWMFYMDANVGCHQSIGATSGVCLVGANDLRGLSGERYIPECPDGPVWDFTWGRWVGGMAHELGHTVGIDHPADSPGGPDDRTLMYLGYVDFPDTYLRPSDRRALIRSGFFYKDGTLPPRSSYRRD